ncbi:MAG TPA: MBL fold metallo-hydrolase [Terriglobia bacterium]|nr:MBL fold metallo-hydrolase [Terriglobia bacterium]
MFARRAKFPRYSEVVRASRSRGYPAILVGLLLLFIRIRPAFSSPREYTVKQIAPGTFVWLPEDLVDQNGDPDFSRAGNAGFIITGEGVVVVDTTNSPFHARDLLYEIRQRTDVPIRLVIDMGPQGDQMLGNEVFAEQRASIVSTATAAVQMHRYQDEMMHHIAIDPLFSSRMRGIHFTFPDKTFGGTMSFAVGGQQIRVVSLHCGLPGTTQGNAAVFLPQAKVAFLGDLYVNGYVPRIDSLDIRRWIAVLGEVENWDAAVYVPSHGSPGTKADLERFRGFLEWLQGRVQGGIRQGKSLIQVERDLLNTQTLYLRAPELAPAIIAAVYRQLAPPQARSRSRAARAPAQPARDYKSLLRTGVVRAGPGQ